MNNWGRCSYTGPGDRNLANARSIQATLVQSAGTASNAIIKIPHNPGDWQRWDR